MIHHALRRPFVLLFVGLLALACLVPAAPQRAAAASDRPVMAFYYPWYEKSDWTYDKMSDLAAPTYSGGDDDTLRRHIQQANAAGIDALICTWYGPNEERLNKRCLRLMQLAQETGSNVKVAIIPDQSAAFDAGMRTVDGLANALSTLKRDFMSSPSYFTFQGKPVVFWFNPPSLGGVGTWQDVRNRADPNREQFWFGGTDNFNYADVFDTIYYFDITWEARPGAAMASYAGRLSSYNRAHNTTKPFIATTMPGYDDIKIRNGHRRDRGNGDYYRGTWQTAINSNAAAVVLTSFNEFFEGSHIEPSEKYGDTYLNLTKELSAKFRAEVGQGAAPTPAPAPPTAPTAPPTVGSGVCRDFPETGHQVCGRLLEYWSQNGGLPVFGYPITDQGEQQVEGKPIQLQIFERNRLELHPENARPYDVLLGRLGADSLTQQKREWTSFPKADASAAHYFADTGHAIAPQFWTYWSNHGLVLDGRSGYTQAESLALFGLPLSEIMTEKLSDGKEYQVQYFERARFEYHSENAAPYDVLLGLLGNELNGKK